MSDKTIIVVGAGVMGTSAALATKRRHPSYTVYLVSDITAPIEPASQDTGKIVRSAYVSDVYVNLALEAMSLWKAEPRYADQWHQSGWIIAHSSAESRRTMSSEQQISKERFLEIFPEASLDDVDHLTLDPAPAWVEASRALETAIKIAAEEGVIVREGKVTNLLWSGSTCTGVELQDGRKLMGSSILLAIGPETPTLLDEPYIGQRVGVPLVGVKLTDEQYERYKDMPILVGNELGEILPPNKEKVIKINNSKSFAVPDLTKLEKALPFTAESPYFDENLDFLHTFLPDLKDAPVVFRRYCLDYLTEKQDFTISPVAGRTGAYVAFGGSFHGWKFLTNIGDYIVRMMDGDESFFEEWKRWSGAEGCGKEFIHEAVIPKRTFPDRS